MTKILYVGGLGRSGSTLLDRMLGQLPGVVSVGEVREIWRRGLIENRLCGCGVPYRECEFWTAVGKEAFGGWDAVDLEAMAALAEAVDRHRNLFALWRPSLARRAGVRVREHATHLAALYAAIDHVAGGAVLVDSSKAPSYLSLLTQVPGVELAVVHLVRDPRGTAFSWSKLVERPDVVERIAHMRRYHPARIALRWTTRNLLMEVMARPHPHRSLRYEQLVATPRECLSSIGETLGLSLVEDDLNFVGDGEVRLGLAHTVQGNPMRMQQGAVALKLDEEWRSAMPPGHRRLVTALTLPLLHHYGYRR